MRSLLFVLVAGVMLVVACDTDEPTLTQPTPERSPAVTESPSPMGNGLPEGFALCTDQRQGYEIGYPQDWHAGSPNLQDECSLFDPQPFEIERGTEAPVVAMRVDDPQRPFAAARDRLADPDAERVLLREETTVAGQEAIRFETEQTRDVLYPEGTMRYGYVINHDGTAFYVETLSIPDAEMNYERNKEVVDQAAGTVDFDV